MILRCCNYRGFFHNDTNNVQGIVNVKVRTYTTTSRISDMTLVYVYASVYAGIYFCLLRFHLQSKYASVQNNNNSTDFGNLCRSHVGSSRKSCLLVR